MTAASAAASHRWLAGLALAGLSCAPALAAPSDSAAREEMVRMVQLEAAMISPETGIPKIDPRVLDAMRIVPREAFLPAPLRPYAYQPQPLPLGYDQNLAAPLLAALMAHLAALGPDDVVFETGTDTGYQAALLSHLAAEVYSVEVVEPLARVAARLMKDLGYANVHTRAGDGYYGWREAAPFDAIIVKEAIDHVPPPLIGQLKRGGRLVMPLGPGQGPQYLTVFTKEQSGKLREERVMPVRFSPLQGGQRT